MSDVEQAVWPASVQAALRDFHQGDLFEGLQLMYFGDGSLPWVEASVVEDEPQTRSRDFDVLELNLGTKPSGYGVITSQTCDLFEEGNPAQPCFQAAPAFIVADDDRQTLPAYFAPLEPPDLPAGRWVADLRIEVPIEKTFLIGRRSFAGFPDEAGYLRFASALGRRRDRAALAGHLVEAVAGTLRKRIRNDKKFRRAVSDHVQSVRLAIERGTREAPVDVRVHVVLRGDGDEIARVRERFETWWDQARDEAEAVGIYLQPNKYHDSRQMDVELYDELIPLHIA